MVCSEWRLSRYVEVMFNPFFYYAFDFSLMQPLVHIFFKMKVGLDPKSFLTDS